MNRFVQIHALVDNASEVLVEIEGLYNKSLSAKVLDPKLLVRIKNLLENLRSALDFLVKEIFDRFCTQPRSAKPIAVYFPILSKTSTADDFEAFMNGRFPGLQQSCPSLYSKLQSYQFYVSASNEWLVQFNELCKKNKHERLSPQTRKEKRETLLTDPTGNRVGWNEGVQFGPGSQITFKEGGTLTFGSGGSIEFGPSGVSVLGRPVDPARQVPRLRPGDKIERIVWVDFVFLDIGVSALPFLKICINRVGAIVDEVKAEIESV